MAPRASSNLDLGTNDALGALLVSALADATDSHVVPRQSDSQAPRRSAPDLRLSLGGSHRDAVAMAVVFLRHAYPRDIREAVWRLDAYKQSAPSAAEPILLVAAESLSAGAKDLLRKRGVAYFERNGTLFLRWRNWLVNIERPTVATARRGDAFALFTEARELVVHALLRHGSEWLTGTALADLAGTSSYTCSVVLQELEKREWCETSGAGQTLRRRLVEPRQLLDAWAQHWIQRKETRSRWYYLPTSSVPLIEQLCQSIAGAGVSMPWALTGAAPANAISPLLTSVEVVDLVVPPGQTEPLARALKAKPAEMGANLSIVERSGAGMQFLEFHGECQMPFTSPFVMYMDLLDGRGRNKELARALRETLKET